MLLSAELEQSTDEQRAPLSAFGQYPERSFRVWKLTMQGPQQHDLGRASASWDPESWIGFPKCLWSQGAPLGHRDFPRKCRQ